MKYKIVIHVGLHKTGSTFLQIEVFNNIISYKLRYDPFAEKPNMNTIFSNESLSGCAYLPSLKYLNRHNIANNLYKIYPDAKIILGIRNKEEWVKSLYSQYIKGGSPHRYDYWHDNIFDKESLDFESYIKYLNSLFPEVFVYRLENLKRDSRKVVDNICSFIGAPSPEFVNNIHNPKWHDNQLKLARWLNKWKPYNVRWFVNKL